LNFIEQSKDKPFFLYLAYNGPYGLGPAQLKDNDRAPHMQDYASDTLPSFERHEPHPWLFNNREYINNIECIRRYAAEVTTIDDGVGEIMTRLESLGLDDDTLVIFTGDNGWSGGQQGIWGMGDHTVPQSAFEWTMTVPLIWRWPGKIRAGATPDIMVSHTDFLPSLTDLLSLSFAGSERATLPGRSYAPLLEGGAVEDWKNELYYEFENLRCIRTENMKWIKRLDEAPDELYDLAADPMEKKQPCHPSCLRGEAQSPRRASRFLVHPNRQPRVRCLEGGPLQSTPAFFADRDEQQITVSDLSSL
jgi:arylsulfatase A-like enzyme